MQLNQFLLWSLLYLTATVISAPLAKRLGMGTVLGFLASGVIIGPSVLNLIGGQDDGIKNFAEFGITMMLFLAGLELELDKLKDLRRQMLGLGVLQVIGVALVIGVGGFFVVGNWMEALAIGLVLSLSSTAIVLQSLQETGQLKTPAGQSVFAVLLFQDISIIPMLALLPLVAGVSDAPQDHNLNYFAHTAVWIHALAIVAAVAAVLLTGRYIMRPLFRFVAASESREVFVALSLLIVVAISLLMGLVGLSASLGAFLAGVVLADSEYRHEIDMDLQPFKGLLLALFFIAVGAEIDFTLFRTEAVPLLIGLVGFLVFKYGLQWLIARLYGMNKPDSLLFAAALTQGSEFGFVLIAFCLSIGLLAMHTAAVLTAIVALSMAAAPLLMMVDRKFVQPRFEGKGDGRAADVIEADGADVVIAGHGRFGMTVGRLLNAQKIKTVVLDYDSSQVDTLRKFGFKVFYGDALRIDLLEAAGARTAKILIIAIDDPERTGELVKIAQANFPQLKLYVRAFDRAHAQELLRMGVDHFYREVFGSSLEMGADILLEFGHTKQDAHRLAKLFRTLDDKFLRKAAKVQSDDEKQLIDLSRQSRAEIARVFADDQAQQEAVLEQTRVKPREKENA